MANTIKDVSKRLLIESALMDYSRFIHVTDADIDELYRKIEKLNEECFNDEKTFALVEKYNLDAITSREDLKKRIDAMRGQLAEKIFDYYATGDARSDLGRHSESIALVLKDIGIKETIARKLAQSVCERKLKDDLSQDELDSFNKQAGKNSKRKKSSDKEEKIRWADLLAQSINDKQKILREKIYLDLQTYQDTGLPNPVIEEMLPDIKAHVSGIKISLNYDTPKRTKPFRERLRDDFKRKGGSKEATLILNGLLAENGKNLIQNGLKFSNYNVFYNAFEDLIKKYYDKEDYQQIIDKALNIQSSGKDKDSLRQERRQVYDRKSQELYCQLVASLISEKCKYDIENNNQGIDYGMYVQTIDQQYIHPLCSGRNNIAALGMVDAGSTKASSSASEERKFRKQIMDDTAENQVASVHHHLPLGAADDVVTRFFGKLDEEEKFVKSCELVNLLGNNCLVIGKDKHQSMEANGAYDVKQNSEGLVFAGRIDWNVLNGVKNKLPACLWKAFEQHLKPDAKIQDVALTMCFPESSYMADLRKTLQPENTTALSKVFERVLE